MGVRPPLLNFKNMKTKDFIKMLQEADPSGEGYIRMSGGVPMFAELKEGYWDGPFTYLDEDGNFVTSINGYKIDIWCLEIDDFVEEYFDLHDPDNWEKIKSKFKFEFGGYCVKKQRDEKIERILSRAKESYNEQYEIHKKLYDDALAEMIENAKKGWKWYQNKEVDNKQEFYYYGWKIIDEKGKVDRSNVYMTESVMESKLWEKVDNGEIEGYYQWVFKE